MGETLGHFGKNLGDFLKTHQKHVSKLHCLQIFAMFYSQTFSRRCKFISSSDSNIPSSWFYVEISRGEAWLQVWRPQALIQNWVSPTRSVKASGTWQKRESGIKER